MRKTIAVFIAIFLFNTGTPLPSFAKEKDKDNTVHLTHREKRQRKRMRKQYEKVRSRANDYRLKNHAQVGVNMFKNQPKKVQKWRSKHHLKP